MSAWDLNLVKQVVRDEIGPNSICASAQQPANQSQVEAAAC